jgi:hypothetical protein
MVFVLLVLLCFFTGGGFVFVRMAFILRVVPMRMNMLVLVGVNQIAVAMFMSVLVGMLMGVWFVRIDFFFWHCVLLMMMNR